LCKENKNIKIQKPIGLEYALEYAGDRDIGSVKIHEKSSENKAFSLQNF
jgi:hypothetical protein